MTSYDSILTEDFIACFRKLPVEIRERARKSYRLWKADPLHPGLHFKKVHPVEPVYSARVSKGWRVIGLMEETQNGRRVAWFWIGSHAEYDALISRI